MKELDEKKCVFSSVVKSNL